jgi:hypothetical protein
MPPPAERVPLGGGWYGMLAMRPGSYEAWRWEVWRTDEPAPGKAEGTPHLEAQGSNKWRWTALWSLKHEARKHKRAWSRAAA